MYSSGYESKKVRRSSSDNDIIRNSDRSRRNDSFNNTDNSFVSLVYSVLRISLTLLLVFSTAALLSLVTLVMLRYR